MTKNNLVIIAGPTASGKTDLAINLAQHLNTEIISADSRLVYRDFNIGTAKPTDQQRNLIKHHLIDIVEPTFNYTAGLYKEDANKIITQLLETNSIPIITGGTGFYIRSAIDGLNIPQVEPNVEYRNELKEFAVEHGNQSLHSKLTVIDPVSAQKLHYNDIFRVIRALEVYKETGKPISELQTKDSCPYDVLYVALTTNNRDFLYKKINERVLTMLESGLIEEVKFLVDKYGKTLPLLKTLGYKEAIDFLEHKCTYVKMIEDIQTNTRHFARRQLIWFRQDKRIIWYCIDEISPEQIISGIIKRIETHD